MDNNTLLGGLLVFAGLGDIGIGLLMGWRMKATARLAFFVGGAVLFACGALLSLGMFKLM